MRRFLLLFVLGAICLPSLAMAQSNSGITFTPEVPLPNWVGGTVSANTFAEYIRAVFVLFIWTVGVLGTVMVVYGGIRWVTAAGNPARINDARDIINNAIIGVIIALTSVVMLNLISPRLTSFQGITIKPVSSFMLEFSKEIIENTGGGISACPRTIVTGTPSQVGSQFGWDSKLNAYINTASQSFSVDPFLIKAIIQQESPKQKAPDNISSPYSGPARVRECATCTRLSSSYGIGQWVSTTLYNQLQRVNGSIPNPECPRGANARQASGSLSTSCSEWLDRRLELQVRMVASYLQIISRQPCVQGNLALTAAGYNAGEGDLARYCSNQELKSTTRQAVTNYVSGIKRHYTTFCNQGASSAPPAVQPPPL